MSLKRFLSFSIPLMIMLFSFAIYISISKMIAQYETTITNDYSIVIVSTAPLTKDAVEDAVSYKIKNVIPIPREQMLNDLKNDLTDGSFELLQTKLPYFYTISLKEFPTTSGLEKIKRQLLGINGMKSVETFSKDHDNVYSLFLFIKSVSVAMFLFMAIFTLFIISSQINLWLYEHSERLSIINLHGGSLLYGAKSIFKLASISSIFSGFAVVGCIYAIQLNIDFVFSAEIAKLINQSKIVYTPIEAIGLISISIIISFMTVFGVLIKHKVK